MISKVAPIAICCNINIGQDIAIVVLREYSIINGVTRKDCKDSIALID